MSTDCNDNVINPHPQFETDNHVVSLSDSQKNTDVTSEYNNKFPTTTQDDYVSWSQVSNPLLCDIKIQPGYARLAQRLDKRSDETTV